MPSGRQTDREAPRDSTAPALHKLLGLNGESPSEAFAEAYAKLRQRYHPDNNPSDPLAPAIIRYLDLAYAELVATGTTSASKESDHAISPTDRSAQGSRKWRGGWSAVFSAIAVATFAIFAVFIFSPTSLVNSAPAGDAAAGQALWTTLGGSPYCGSCHGANGQGGFGPDLAGRRLTFEQFRQQLRKPYGIMPAYTEQQISDQQVADLVAYFNGLPEVAQLGPWRVTVPVGAPLGQRYFIEAVGCGQCHGATADRQRQGETRQGVTTFAQFAELVYSHTGTFPNGRMGNYSRTRLPEQTLETIWQWESQELGLRVPLVPTLSAASSATGAVTYELTLDNQAKGWAAGQLYIALSVPAGASVTNSSSYGFQRVETYAAGGYDIAVWLTPQIAAGEKRTYSMTVAGPAAAAGSGAFVRWLAPTRAGDQLIAAAVVPR